MDDNKHKINNKERETIHSITASVLNYGLLSNGIITKGDYPLPALGIDEEENKNAHNGKSAGY
jgi:hypothetical protein